MLPLQLPSLPPVPSQELKVSENNVTLVWPFIPKGIIMQTISAKAAIKKVKLLFIARLFLFYFYLLLYALIKSAKIRLLLIQQAETRKLIFWRIPTGCKRGIIAVLPNLNPYGIIHFGIIGQVVERLQALLTRLETMHGGAVGEEEIFGVYGHRYTRPRGSV